MTRDDFLYRVHSLSIQAGMNQRYHQQQEYRYWWRDTAAKITTAVAAIVAFGLSCISVVVDSTPLDVFGAVIALITTVSAIVLNVVPFGSWEREHRELFRRWTDLREEVDVLGLYFEGEPSGNDLQDLKKLEAKMHRICGQERNPEKAELDKCYEAECKSREPASCEQSPAAAA